MATAERWRAALARLGSPMRDKPAARRPPAGLRIERSRPAGQKSKAILITAHGW